VVELALLAFFSNRSFYAETMPRRAGRTCGVSLCWHCQHPQWKRKCLGPGGTKDDSHKDYQERHRRRSNRAKPADAILDQAATGDANVTGRAKRASSRSAASVKASTPVAQTGTPAVTPAAVQANVAGKKRSILQILQGPECREESEPASKKNQGGGLQSSTALSVPLEPAHVPVEPDHAEPAHVLRHYATLGIAPGASLDDLCRAYRRQSLLTHPDKGGKASLFREVTEAFHALSDRLKHADSNDLSAPACKSPDDEVSTVHSVCLAMLALPRSSWHGLLVGLKLEVLKALEAILEEGADGVAEDEYGESPGVDSTTGVRGKAGNYSVKLGWRHFYVKNGRPIRTLERALDINVSLLRMRNAAMLRYEGRARDLRRAERGQDQSSINATDDCCPPLMPCELHEMLLRLQDPLMFFVFAFDLTKKPRMMSPWTPRIDAAQHYHDLICRVQARKYRPLAQALDPKVDIANMMQEQAGREREERRVLERDMAAAVTAEVARRQQEPPTPADVRTDAHMRCDTLAVGNQAQLAVLDECREAVVATRHSTEALQEELQKRAAADDVRHRRSEEKMEGLMKQVLQLQEEKRTASSDDFTRFQLEEEILRLQSLLQKPRPPVATGASPAARSRITWRSADPLFDQRDPGERAAQRQISRTSRSKDNPEQRALKTARGL